MRTKLLSTLLLLGLVFSTEGKASDEILSDEMLERMAIPLNRFNECASLISYGLKGGDEKSVPKVAANFKIVNNHIYKFGQITRVYAAGINSGFTGGGGGGHHAAVGMYIAHNLVHDAPHVGVLFGSWNSVFEYNEIFDY